MAGKEKPLKKYSIRVRFEHLNPKLQVVIGEKVRVKDILSFSRSALREFVEKLAQGVPFGERLRTSTKTIKEIRVGRSVLEAATLISLAKAAAYFKGKQMQYAKIMGGVGMATALDRIHFARWIQLKHEHLVREMKKVGILQTKYEKNYPRDWLNPTIVAKTHPSFFVNWRGDLIFPKMTRTEYARYQFQKSFAGKIGLNAWRWRGYLEPPEAPKPVMAWAKEKAMQWAAAMRPKPAFESSTVRLKKSTLFTRRKQIRRI